MRLLRHHLPLVVLAILVAAACSRSGASEASDPTADEREPTTETAGPSPAAEASFASLPPLTDIAYGDDDRHVLDIYLPDADGPHPTILAIHGGAFRTRSKDFYNRIGPLFAERGYAFVAINYRLVPSHTYPAQVEDAFCALAWLHANHERHGFDPTRVAAWGGSAGGYLAAMLGTVDDPERFLDGCAHDYPAEAALNAVAVFYGLFDFTDISDYPSSGIPTLTQFWGAEHHELSAQQLADMSPIEQIDGSEPPFILLHGTEDLTIPSIMSERFAAALADAGVEVELVLMEDTFHAFEQVLWTDKMSPTVAAVATFLNEQWLR